MKKYITLLFILLSSTLHLFGQVNEDAMQRQVVLNDNVADSLYVFGKWTETGGEETHLRYLGTLTSPAGKWKIMTSSWFWGLSKRATSRILVFDEKNNYLGNFYVVMPHDLPEKIKNNQLVFLHSKSDDCDQQIITRISFENGIPDEFFLECKDGYGDVYTFEKAS